MPQRDRRIGRYLVLGLGLLLGVAACTWQGLSSDGDIVRQLYISGEGAHVSDARIGEIAADYIERPLHEVDIEALRAELTNLAWLREVNVSRHWPDGLVVRFVEHRPVARWGERALLAADGQTFMPEDLNNIAHLPYLQGPEDSGLEVLQQYRAMADTLAAHGVGIERLALDARGSWTAHLDNGLELRLGRDAIAARLGRFVRYGLGDATARDALAEAGYVDLRYDDGFAVGGTRISDDTAETSDEQKA